MARPRKPSNVLELNGSFKNHPERARERENEPVPEAPLGGPPDYLSELELVCWNEIVRLCHPGTVFENDRMVIEHTARAWAGLRASKEYTNTALMIRLEAGLTKLGLTPADRSRVQVLKRDPNANSFAKFKKPSAA